MSDTAAVTAPATPPASTPGSAPAGAPADPAKQIAADLTGDAPEGKASEPKKEPQPKPPPKFKVKSKIGETETEEEITLDEIQRDRQKWLAANKRFEEAAKTRKDAEALLKMMEDDPEAFFDRVAKNKGKTFKQLAEERLMREYEEAQMPPEQKALMEAKREAEAYKAQVEAFKRQQEEAQKEAYRQQFYAQQEQRAMEAFDAAGYKDPAFVRAVLMPLYADVQQSAWENGYELTPQQMAGEVEGNLQKITTRHIGTLDGEGLIRLLGAAGVKKITDHLNAKLRVAPIAPRPVAPPPSSTPEPPQRHSMTSFMSRLNGTGG